MWIERCMTIQGRRDISEQLTTWWEQVIVSAQVTFSHSLENHFMGFWWGGQSGCSVPQNSSYSGTVHDSERLTCATLGFTPKTCRKVCLFPPGLLWWKGGTLNVISVVIFPNIMTRAKRWGKVWRRMKEGGRELKRNLMLSFELCIKCAYNPLKNF